jgi:hypothetical protein
MCTARALKTHDAKGMALVTNAQCPQILFNE